MRILSFILLFLASINLGISQSSSDYCICDEASPDLNYFIIEELQNQEVAPTLDKDFANFNQGWTAPPSFYSSASSGTRVITSTFTSAPTDPIESQEARPHQISPTATEALPNPTSNLLPEEKETSPPASVGAGDAPNRRNQGGRALSSARTTKKSKSLNPRIKRKKSSGRLKNKRGKKVKRYRGQCPHF